MPQRLNDSTWLDSFRMRLHLYVTLMLLVLLDFFVAMDTFTGHELRSQCLLYFSAFDRTDECAAAPLSSIVSCFNLQARIYACGQTYIHSGAAAINPHPINRRATAPGFFFITHSIVGPSPFAPYSYRTSGPTKLRRSREQKHGFCSCKHLHSTYSTQFQFH